MHIIIFVFYQVLTFLRVDRLMSANPNVKNPQPCVSLHLSKFVRKLGDPNVSSRSVMALVASICQGHHQTSNQVAFLKDGSEALFVSSKKQKDKVDVTRALQIHKCLL